MTPQDETRITSQRAIVAARITAQAASASAMAAESEARRLFLAALANPTNAALNQRAQNAQDRAAQAEAAAVAARATLVLLVAAQPSHITPALQVPQQRRASFNPIARFFLPAKKGTQTR